MPVFANAENLFALSVGFRDTDEVPPPPRPVVRPPTIMVVVVRKTPLVVLPRTAAALWLHYYIRYPLMPDGAFRTMLHRCVYCRIIIAWLEDKSESA